MFEKLKIRILGWLWDHSCLLKVVAKEDDKFLFWIWNHSKGLKEIAEEDENLIEKVEDTLMDDPERLRELAYVGR